MKIVSLNNQSILPWLGPCLLALMLCGCAESVGTSDPPAEDGENASMSVVEKRDVVDYSDRNFGDEELAAIVVEDAKPRLDVSNTQVTDAGLAAIEEENLERVVELNLSGTQITDSGIASLSRATSLRKLDLSHTQVTAASLDVLKQLPNLAVVKLHGTSISREEQLEMIKFLGPRYHEHNSRLSQEFLPADFQDNRPN